MIFDARVTHLSPQETANHVARALRRIEPKANIEITPLPETKGYKVKGSYGDRGVTVEISELENGDTYVNIDVWGTDPDFAQEVVHEIDQEIFYREQEQPRMRG